MSRPYKLQADILADVNDSVNCAVGLPLKATVTWEQSGLAKADELLPNTAVTLVFYIS